MRTSDDHAVVGSNVDARDRLVMALEFIFQDELGAGPFVEFDIAVSCDCEGLPVGGEGVVGNGMVEEVVDFWTGHCVADER